MSPRKRSTKTGAAKAAPALTLADATLKHTSGKVISGRELVGVLGLGGPNRVAEILWGIREMLPEPENPEGEMICFTIEKLAEEIYTTANNPNGQDVPRRASWWSIEL